MKEKYLKDFNGEKIFSLEYDKETLKDMVLDKQEEIERLNNIIKEVREYIGLTDEDREYLGIYDVNGIGILNILDKVEGINEKENKWKKKI